MLVAMGTVRDLHPRQVGQTAWQAMIGVGIGDDENVDCVADAELPSLAVAKAWVEKTLPTAGFPEWVHRRVHGTAGAFLFGSVSCGWYDTDLVFEPDPDGPVWDADLVQGRLRWRRT